MLYIELWQKRNQFSDFCNCHGRSLIYWMCPIQIFDTVIQTHNRLVSSAKWWTFQIFIVLLRLFIYNKNRRGPRTDPRGIPQFIEARPDSYPFMDTY